MNEDSEKEQAARERAQAMYKPTEAQREADAKRARRAQDAVRKQFSNGLKPGKMGDAERQLRALVKVYGPVEAAMHMALGAVNRQRAQLVMDEQGIAEDQYLHRLASQVVDLIMLQRFADLGRIQGVTIEDMHRVSEDMAREQQAVIQPGDERPDVVPVEGLPLEILQQVAAATGASPEQVQESITNALQQFVLEDEGQAN